MLPSSYFVLLIDLCYSDFIMSYSTVFQLVCEEFKKANIPFILIGGFAVNAYGVSRNTMDVDFLIEEENCKQCVEILEKNHFQVDESRDAFVRLINSEFYPPRLDLMLVSKTTFEKIWPRVEKKKIAGYELMIPSVEHLIALKLHSMKNNANREWKDLPDVIGLIKINHIDVKTKEFLDLCLKFGTEELYNRIQEAIK